MVDRNSNIDLVFRNGLKEFEVLPPPDLWDNIRPAVRRKSESALYMRAAILAGLVVAGGALAWYFSGTLAKNFNGPAITLNQDVRPEGTYRSKALKEKPVAKASSEPGLFLAGSLQTREPATTGEFSPAEIRTEPISNVSKESFLINSQGRPFISSAAGIKSRISVPYRKDIVQDLNLADAGQAKEHKDRWSVGAFMSPTYFSKLGTGSTDQEKALASSENTIVSYAGGMSFGVKVNKRLSLQMGILYNTMNQEIDEVRSYSGFMKFYSMKGTDNFEVATSTGTIISRNNDIFLANLNTGKKVSSLFSSDIFDPNKAGLTYLNNTVYQSFNYLEVPLFVRYKLIDRTLGMNLVGGFSYNKLMSNSAYAVSGENKYYIGETDGLNPFVLSSSFGLGMEYSLSKNFSINLEPTFKYFLTPMSAQTGTSMHPYTFGIFSGVSWKF